MVSVVSLATTELALPSLSAQPCAEGRALGRARRSLAGVHLLWMHPGLGAGCVRRPGSAYKFLLQRTRSPHSVVHHVGTEDPVLLKFQDILWYS